MSWTGPIPQQSLRHNFFLDYLVHPLKRQLAKIYLIILKKNGLVIIGITGSYGKTTTKSLLSSILSQKSPTFTTDDNTDSVYNIPNTVLHTPLNTKYLILEMSIEYPGEMNFYIWLAQPEIAIITAISPTHTEFLTDTKTIAREKSLIAKYAHTTIIGPNPEIKVTTSGNIIKVQPQKLQLPENLVGDQFQLNAALAAETAKLLNFSQEEIEQGLKKSITPKHRMQLIKSSSGATIIDDVHNANPDATKSSISALITLANKYKKEPVLVFGQMNELGKYEESAHTEVGELINKLKIKHLFTVGPATKFTIDSAKVGQLCENIDDIFKNLQPFLNSKYIILIKASRSWHLENLVDKITSSI